MHYLSVVQLPVLLRLFQTVFCFTNRFPRNLWAPGQMQQQVEEFIWHCGSFEGKTVLDIERFLYREARECFEVIEKMLANSTFFFGDRPTQIDAAIYGYLAILLKAPLVSTEIKVRWKGSLYLL